MPPKRFNQAKISRLPKTRRSKYLAERHSKDRQQAKDRADAIYEYLEKASLENNPEKEFSLIVWTPSFERMFKHLAAARQIALKYKLPPLDSCRDDQQFLALEQDLLMAHIKFVSADLRQNRKYRAQLIDEWMKKVNPFPKTKDGQELRESLESLEQSEENAREIGKLTLKVTSDKPA